MNIEDTGRDAIRLAAALNHYERAGFPNGQDGSSSAPNVPGDGQSRWERGLWRELVETYSAESLNLEGVGTGMCCIVLSSGDLVFYSPAHRKWMWLILEQADAEPLAVHDEPASEHEMGGAQIEPGPAAPISSPDPPKPPAGAGGHDKAPSRWRHPTRSPSELSDALSPTGPNPITVKGMTQVLSSQNTPAAYEEALFVTEGLLLGATYGNRVVPYEELVWVVEAATGHSLHLQSMGRFIGDLVERSYPRHMEVLSALAVPATVPSEPTLETRPVSEIEPLHASGTDESSTDDSVVDLTEAGMSPTPQNVVGRPS